jgi:hypothetical protein
MPGLEGWRWIMRLIWIGVVLSVLGTVGTSYAADPTVAVVTHEELQAVDADGVATYEATDKVILTGIILNNPEEIVDPTPGESTGFMGGQWQVYVQGEGDDHAGTAVYMGQYYAKAGGSGNYSDHEWLAEMQRVNYDPNTGYQFTAGDRVRVTGWYKFFKGKLNVNEKHQVDSLFDLQIELLKPAVGLPQPEVITLDQVKNDDGQYIFDETRLTGCEYYQGRRVRVDDVNVVDPENWVADGTVTIRDHAGRTFPMKLGLGAGFTMYACPTGQIDVIAIFDQESSGYTVCQDGYRLWVPNYDGNGLVLTDRGDRRTGLPWEAVLDERSR